MTCPLITAGGTRVGFLFFTSCHRNTYQPHHVDMFLQIAAMLSGSIEKSRLYERVLRAEKDSERLLHQILPPKIAERLLSGETIADYHRQAGIIFADLEGFTQWSSERTPGEVVCVLSELFAEVDVLAHTYGVQKVKTIGDSWMGGGAGSRG